MDDGKSLDWLPTERDDATPAGPADHEPAVAFDDWLTENGATPGVLGRIDRYELLERLGGGGFGSVFLAYDTVAKIEVAVKGLPPLIRHVPDELERVRQNFALVQRLRHPHIAGLQVLHRAEKVWYATDEAGEQLRVDKGDYLLVMEYVPGVTLSQWRRQFPGGRVPVPEAMEVVRQVAGALDHAHEQRIVHRDVKPANVMVVTKLGAGSAERGAPGTKERSTPNAQRPTPNQARSTKHQTRPHPDTPILPYPDTPPPPPTSIVCKVLDFGLAAEIRSSMSRVSQESGDTSGTRPYMAPEQWAGDKQDAATDQYALAVLFHELVAGEVPFVGAFETGDTAIMLNAVENRPPSPLAELSKRQNKALLTALAKAPAARFPSCGEFAGALGGAKGGAGIPPARPRLARAALWLALPAVLAAGMWVWQSRRPPHPSVPPTTSPPGQSGQLGQSSPSAPPGSPGQPAEAVATAAKMRFVIQPGGAKVTVHGDAGLVGSGVTDASGAFALNLPPGRYELFAQKDGYELLPLTFEMGEAADSRSLSLTPLRGGVAVTTVAGASVKAINRSTRAEIALGQAGADGQLHYDRLVEGEYELAISHPDYHPRTERVEVRKDRPAAVDARLQGLPGSIFVVASPQAEVWVDGKRQGDTGAQLDGLPPGPRRFEVRRAGYRTERFDETIPPNAAAPRKVLGNLARESGAIRVEATVPAAARDHFAGIDKRLRFGEGEWKTIRALPHVEDGLACEEHQVRLEAPGYTVEPANRQATVRDSQTAAASFTLSPKPGTATVTANVANAEVFAANGARLGKAGDKLSLAPFADHRLTVKAPGHADAVAMVRIPHPEADAGTTRVTLEEVRGLVPGANGRIDDLGLDLVWVASGSFRMGSNDGHSDEKPVREVRISRGFWLGKHEVRQSEYEVGMSNNPSYWKGADLPVEQVSWNDAVEFCRKLTQRERQAGRLPEGYVYRLPTEAEWEYAARGGANGRNTQYAGSDDINAVAWYDKNSGGKTQRVGTKAANELGLHDMSGNVWEWCHDWYGNYPSGAATDPSGPGTDSLRVRRGGSWGSVASDCRVAYRSGSTPSRTGNRLGFRVSLAPPVQ